MASRFRSPTVALSDERRRRGRPPDAGARRKTLGHWGYALDKINRAGRAMVVSGVMGLLAFASLFAALYMRETTASQEQWAKGVIQPGIWDTLFRGHDVGVILQALLLVPAALSFRGRNSESTLPGLPPMAVVGVVANVSLALSLLMVFVLKASDMLYIVPQGFVGVWVLSVAQARPPGTGNVLRVLGWVSGLGLVLVALACLGVAAAIGPSVLALVGPVPIAVDPEGVRGPLNAWSHMFLDVGTVLGVLTLPIWSILAGLKIARARRSPPAVAADSGAVIESIGR